MLASLAARLPSAPAGTGQIWVGDDAAVVAPPPGPLLLAADVVVAGVHADLAFCGLDDLGWKAMAVNASDMAAMGGTPTHALISISGELTSAGLDRLYDGISAAAEEYRCPVVGGDLSGGSGLVVSVAMTGDGSGPGQPVSRSGARPGDIVWVTGPLGASAAGLALLAAGRAAEAPHLAQAHRRPRALVAHGRAARAGGASAMIDVSDGLALDLRRLAVASEVDVLLDRVPVAPGVELAGADPENFALAGGEDYQLVFAGPDRDAMAAAFSAAGLDQPIEIGRCRPGVGEVCLRGQPLDPVGWQHRW
ncbi:MAG: thiamine-phosphate kinase [Acidimicrobiales bacterium]